MIYADPESLTRKTDRCKTNPEKWSTTKVSVHIPSGFLISTISSFKVMKIKHDVYRGNNCMKKFGELLREYEMKIIDFGNTKMKLVTNEKSQKSVIFIKDILKIKILNLKNIAKLKIILIIQVNMEVLPIAYVI